jgi:predicted dehydrogenase
MARTLADCDAILQACTAANVTLLVGHVRRYDEDWGTWHRLVISGAVGRPVLWRQTMGGSGPGKWYMDDEAGGGPFLDGCVHNWDFANMVFGEPEAVVASLMRLGGRTALDSGTAVVRYASGDEVSLCWSWGLPSGTRTGTNTDILGPEGVIRFPGSFPKVELPEGFDETTHGAYLLDTGGEKRIVEFPVRNMFAEQWRDFQRSADQGVRPKATGAMGRRAVEVALAVLEAGRTGTTIPIGAAL